MSETSHCPAPRNAGTHAVIVDKEGRDVSAVGDPGLRYDPRALALEPARPVELHRVVLAGQRALVVRGRGEAPGLGLAEVGADRRPSHIVPDLPDRAPSGP